MFNAKKKYDTTNFLISQIYFYSVPVYSLFYNMLIEQYFVQVFLLNEHFINKINIIGLFIVVYWQNICSLILFK
jgi:hypothetical protein